MLIPDKLTPVPELDRSLLPSWIKDVGTVTPDPGEEHENTMFVMKARDQTGVIHHIAVDASSVVFDDTFWVRYAEPMVNNLGISLFETEYPDVWMNTVRWEVESTRLMEPRQLTDRERNVIARRNELSAWRAPMRVFPD